MYPVLPLGRSAVFALSSSHLDQMNEIPPTRPMSFTRPISSFPTFQSVFNAALDEYTNKTGRSIAEHPLAAKLEICRSPNDVLRVLQEQAHDFREFREGNKRLMTVLEPTVNVSCALSDAFGNGVGLVRALDLGCLR